MIATVSPAGFGRFIRAAGQPAIFVQRAPSIDDAEKKRLIKNAPNFGLTLRPDIAF